MELDRFPSACCDLDLWPFDPIYEPKYMCDQNLVKFHSLVLEIRCSQDFRVIASCDLDLWPCDPKANQHIYEPKYVCVQNWLKFPSLVLDRWCSQCQGLRYTPTCLRTHTQTDGQTPIQNASALRHRFLTVAEAQKACNSCLSCWRLWCVASVSYDMSSYDTIRSDVQNRYIFNPFSPAFFWL